MLQSALMWERWLFSYPELRLLDLDVGRRGSESRALHNVTFLTQLLMPYDEKALFACLLRLAEHDMFSAAVVAEREARKGALLPDIHLLAGAFYLGEHNLEEAVRQLGHCYQAQPEPGLAISRMYPSLRILLRVTPCVLFPLYPNAYGTALLYAVALWHAGEAGEALEVLREMVFGWGLYDELRVLGGLIHLRRGDLERAVKALSVAEVIQRDALELTRALYLAYAHYLREEYRTSARVLVAALQIVRDVNPHLHARARLLVAELYERNGMPLNALRESGRVLPNEVPGEVAALVLRREERWVTELSLLSDIEIERLAHADAYAMYVPDQVQPKAVHSPLDTTRDPGKRLRVKAMSWLKRQEEERQIESYRAALARGEDVSPPGGRALSPAGMETKARIRAAEHWWPARRQGLMAARPNAGLERPDPSQVGHVRFDFCGSREPPAEKLWGEKRAQTVTAMVLASVLIFVVLWVLQTCVY